ncbi:UDP-glucose 4-epimerase [archaeon SCG-AAA382B04]|nr:UDP-glucose 4-epimerase [archaeon SCG-AAA382B04]
MNYDKILVTGSAGFIGHHLVKELLEMEKEVVGIDDLSNGKQKNITDIESKNYTFIRGDVRKKSQVEESMAGCDAVFHLAAQSSVPEATNALEKDLDINLNGTINVLQTAKEIGAKVVFASTSTVYGTPKQIPTPEDTALEPISFYGASKTSAEAYCFAMHGTHNHPIVNLRLYNAYGPRNEKGVMYDFVEKLTQDPSTLEVLGTGEQTKDYIYIKDAIDAFILALQRGEAGEAYNVGSGKAYSVKQIAKMIFDLMDVDPEVTYTGGKGWKGDVETTKADITKLKNLGWKPTISLKEGLKKFYRWYMEK